MGKLVLVPTPLGNLEDITLRSLRILKEADLILAEDTRTSGNLLRLLDISRPLRAFHQHNEHQVLNATVRLVQESTCIALITDAGTPGISDPGFLLVRACIEAGIEVECLPGATALIPALVISGLPADRFCFEGFLPHKKGRQTKIKKLAEEDRTIVLYESPYRLVKTLRQLAEFLGADRKAAVVRELTKMFEECRRGTLLELADHYEKNTPKGEIVLVVGAANQFTEEESEEEEDASEVLFKGRAKRNKQ
jgi:16S rRNA (cytidine1402-2'-O)-methyltransferase